MYEGKLFTNKQRVREKPGIDQRSSYPMSLVDSSSLRFSPTDRGSRECAQGVV